MRSCYALTSFFGAITIVTATSFDLSRRWPESLPESFADPYADPFADPLANPFADAFAQSSFDADDAAQAKKAAALKLIGTMPKCGLVCIASSVQASPCSFEDTNCSCNNKTISEQAAQCIMVSCTVKETLTTKNISDTICGKPIRDKTGITTGTGIGGMIFAIVAVIIRTISKIHIQTGGGTPAVTTDLWWDDLAVGTSLVFVIAFGVIPVPLTRLGFGKDVWTVPFQNLTPMVKLMLADEIVYVFGLGLVKISLLLTYLRFFSSDRFRHITYVVIVLNALFILSFVIVILTQCRPLSYTWNQWDGEHKGKCLALNPIVWSSYVLGPLIFAWLQTADLLYSAIINIILDFLVLGLPIYQLWKMNLNVAKKLQVMFMFGVGFLVTIISIMRLHSIVDYGEDKNFTYSRVIPGVWSKLELQLSVICACMPAIRQVIRRFSPRLIGTTRGEGTTTGISTTQSGLSGRTIAISEVGKSADTEVRGKSSSHSTIEEMD
ncbi:hypothetical protein CB0940_03448 [Cercospora beticola]|uniref:CFEM domain-containing protein n=1 Tax=Cercospora beticola TaxID=122368 RepID=A0A2G5I2L1_CERBT|nr:hypothetical protein CB0940_03448 [Cercospora beticola]PIA99029.1 hypothetical protein CB0940_03448 [Cercospora beticola]